MKKLVAFLRERAAVGESSPVMIEGGASFAYTFGKILVFLLLLEGVTGAALSAFYSPSTTDAWGSVAYIQDQSALGWLVRGVHHHGGGAIVIVAGIHLIQTAVAGAYKKPRELVWWLGVILLMVTLAWAVTGYVLRWDQAGYWANRVELGIAAGTPVIGGTIKDLALGGNDYGNLTLTRFYALHVIVLPAVVALLTGAHIYLAKKHGPTPVREGKAAPRWPDQAIRDAFAMLVTVVVLFGYVGMHHGVELASPADPSNAYDARPLWYFRWLFELRELAGSAEKIVALVVPAIVGGFLIGLPLADKGPDRSLRTRKVYVGAVAGLFAIIGALTVMSFARDSGDEALAGRQTKASALSDRARALAMSNGVPASGALDVFSTPPMYKARKIFAQKCAGCHVEGKDRKGPLIGPGHGNRAWIKAFLLDPSNDLYWGRTKLVAESQKAQALEKAKPKDEPKPDDKPAPNDKKPDQKKPDDKKPGPNDDKKPDKPDDKKPDDGPQDLAMKPVDLKDQQLDNVVEYLYAQSGAADFDKAKAEDGGKAFESTCTDCHSSADSVAGASGPNLYGLGARDFYTSFIGNPKKPIHMTEAMSGMPRFDKELTIVERDLLAEYLIWLRTASKADLDALGPL